MSDQAFEKDKAIMLHAGSLRSARSSLLWVAVLLAVGELFAFASSGGKAAAALVVGLALAALFGVLWRWSERNALGATGTGLGVYVTLQALELAVDPAILLQGLIVKIVVLVFLIRGVRAALVLRRHGVSSL